MSITQVLACDKPALVEWIGALPAKRVRQILDGLRMATAPAEASSGRTP